MEVGEASPSCKLSADGVLLFLKGLGSTTPLGMIKLLLAPGLYQDQAAKIKVTRLAHVQMFVYMAHFSSTW